MKKALKIVAWTLVSLLLVVIIAVSVAVWIVFTPKKLTPIVRNVAADFVTCPYEVGSVELTFFSTFPQFGLRINHLFLQNQVPAAPSDTLLYVDELVAGIDVRELLRNNSIVLDDFCSLNGLVANVFVDADGTANYDIFVAGDTVPDTDTTAFNLPFDRIDVPKMTLCDVRLSYTDLPAGICAAVAGLSADVEANLAGSHVQGNIALSLPDVSASMDSITYLQHAAVALTAPLEADLDEMSVRLTQASVALNQYLVSLDGTAALPANGDILLDMDVACNEWQIEPLLALVPAEMDLLPAGLQADGRLGLSAHIAGTFNDSLMPLVTARVQLDEGRFSMPEIPYTLKDIQADVSAHVDMNNTAQGWATVDKLAARTAGNSSVELSGRVDKLLDDNMLFNLMCRAYVHLPELEPVLPEDMDVDVQGTLNANVAAGFSMAQLEKMDIAHMRINGTLAFRNLALAYDSLRVNSGNTTLTVTIPNPRPANDYVGFLAAGLQGDVLNVSQGNALSAVVQRPDIAVQLSDILSSSEPLWSVACNFGFDGIAAAMDDMSAELDAPQGNAFVRLNMQDSTSMPTVTAELSMANLKGKMDTISARIGQPKLKVNLTGRKKDKSQPRMRIDYDCAGLQAVMGSWLQAETNRLGLVATASYNDKGENLLLQWNPRLDVDLQQGKINMAGFPETIGIPEIKFNFNNRLFTIDDSRIQLGNSDFQLKGEIRNIAEWLANKDLLTGELDFVSNKTDVNQLMDLTSGLGAEPDSVAVETVVAETVAETAPEQPEAAEPNPYMVPQGVDLVLHTDIKEALVGKQTVHNLGGNLYVKDGTLILEEMGFVCNAARLQLTAMYKTPRKNHLYLGLDYHMLDINIEELIDMIPMVDSIVPMLRSFKGNAEFHIAAETYLDGNYNLKMSTLRGASSIRGYDLVLMDSETFTEISKLLLFKKKTENVVDSIAADLTVFRNEVDIYPLLVSIDKYQAALGGRHNLDMTFNYHVSLLRPLRIGVNVKGNFDDMQIRLARCKYAKTFKPSKRQDVETQRAALRQLIYTSLSSQVKEQAPATEP